MAARAVTGGPAPHAPAAADSITPPEGLDDLQAWLDYRMRAHVPALPLEARIFYRRGLLLHASGGKDEAARLVHGAADLDPGFIAPHLTLASWNLLSDPSQSLLHWASVLERGRDSFRVQLALASGMAWLLLQALLLGLLGVGILLAAVHQGSLRHALRERLARWAQPLTLRFWPWFFLLLPFAVGLGPVLPTLAVLGLLWTQLRGRERVVPVLLAIVAASLPWGAAQLDRLTMPLREDRAPFYGMVRLEDGIFTAGRETQFTELAAREPGNPFVQFAHGWLERHANRQAEAESAYRRVLEARPGDDRALNNLGNAVFQQGRADEAIEIYQRAIELNPANPAAHFNLSQVYTHRYDYQKATEHIARASALDFDLVKQVQSQATEDGVLPLVDQWLSPRSLWIELAALPARGYDPSMLPPLWRGRPEASGETYSLAVALVTLLSIVASIAMNRQLPLRTCSNCGQVVCRRCAQRRREFAFCPACAAVEARAESPEFARVLLLQHRRKAQSPGEIVRGVLSGVVPGYGLVSMRRVFVPIVLLSFASAMLAGGLGIAAPFGVEAQVARGEAILPVPLVFSAWVGIYAVSIFGFLAARARAHALALPAAPARSRPTQSTHSAHSAAA
jgi:tetratricopeptide (TPR) repeat protein